VPEEKSIALTTALKSSPQAGFVSIRCRRTWRDCLHDESLNCHDLAEENTSAELMKIIIAQGKVVLCLCNGLTPLQQLSNLTPEKEALTVTIDLGSVMVVDHMLYFILLVFMAASV